MKQETRSGAQRVSQPIMMLRETRFMSRDEILRELRRQSGGVQGTTHSPVRSQQRCGAGG
jgi:hypothetical protein